MLVARRALTVGKERRFPGDPVPEAATWKNLRVYLDAGWVEEVPDESPEPPPPSPPPPLPSPPKERVGAFRKSSTKKKAAKKKG